jgi:hypothetical protein
MEPELDNESVHDLRKQVDAVVKNVRFLPARHPVDGSAEYEYQRRALEDSHKATMSIIENMDVAPCTDGKKTLSPCEVFTRSLGKLPTTAVIGASRASSCSSSFPEGMSLTAEYDRLQPGSDQSQVKCEVDRFCTGSARCGR